MVYHPIIIKCFSAISSGDDDDHHNACDDDDHYNAVDSSIQAVAIKVEKLVSITFERLSLDDIVISV